jgi:hypothetical protein
MYLLARPLTFASDKNPPIPADELRAANGCNAAIPAVDIGMT